MDSIIGLDPGPEKSGIVQIDPDGSVDGRILGNEELLNHLMFEQGIMPGTLVVEMIASYGMPVGKEVFETCVWIGKFEQAWSDHCGSQPERLFRREVKLELCGSPRAKDANVRQALIDIYGPGKDKAIGLKKTPGPLYGFKADMWAALGVAVTYKRIAEQGPRA